MDKLFKDEPLLLIDAYAWIFRAFYALPDFRNSSGEPTAAVHGFLSSVRKLVDRARSYSGARPEVAIFFDRGAPKERLSLYGEYKANRPETPADLRRQVPFIEEALAAMGLPQVAMDGVEADDVIASFAVTEGGNGGRRVLIASNDKDFFQILSGRISLLRASSGQEEIDLFDVDRLKNKYGLPPACMVDFYALVGDDVDNVPGVMGIGEKTAAKLLTRYSSLDEIYDHLGDLPKATAKILARGRESAFLSQRLVRLRTDLIVAVNPVVYDPETFDRKRLLELLSRLELRRLADRL